MSHIIPYDPDQPPEAQRREPAPAQSVRDAYYILFRHKARVLFCLGAALLGVLLMLFFSAPQYRCEARLLVTLPTASSATTEGASLPASVPASTRLLQTEVALLTSSDVAAEVARRVDPSLLTWEDRRTNLLRAFKPKTPAPFSDALRTATAHLQERLQVEPIGESAVLQLTYSSTVASTSFLVLQSWLDVYRERRQAWYQEALGSAGTPPGFAVVQQPTLPAVPEVAPKGFKVFLALLVGLGLGVLAAFLAEFLDPTLKNPDEIQESLRLPTFTSIPTMEPIELAPRAGPPAAKANLLERTFNAEAAPYFDELRDRVFLSLNGNAKRPVVIAVTSCTRGEGVTTVACNLAVNLARHGHDRVLLMDTHLNRPRAHEVLGMNGGSNGSARTSDGQPTTAPVEENLFLMEAHTEVREGAGDLLSDFHEMLEWVDEHQYEFVLLDLPPIGESAAAARVAGSVDGVLLVTEAERVRSQVARQTRSLLLEARANVLGAVLNKRSFYVPEWLYQRV